MAKPYISSSVIKRMPRYYRHLGELKSEGRTRISSVELAKRLGFTASQIRQDLNCFGEFGQQGYGYDTEQELLSAVAECKRAYRKLSEALGGA